MPINVVHRVWLINEKSRRNPKIVGFLEG